MSTITPDRMSTARHDPKLRTPAVTAAIAADRRAAHVARDAGLLAESWRLLERIHILSQPWPWLHVRSHIDMLRLAVRSRDRHEIVGQIARMLVAGPGSATGRYPRGNTGRANVPATRPMPLPEDLAGLLAEGEQPRPRTSAWRSLPFARPAPVSIGFLRPPLPTSSRPRPCRVLVVPIVEEDVR